MKKVNLLLASLALAIPFLLAPHGTAALAQTDNSTVAYKNVQLSIYPELDDPRLLVVLVGTLEGVSPPAMVDFMVPNTSAIWLAGSMEPDGSFDDGHATRVASNITGWDKLSFQAVTDTFRVEYYDPSIVGYPQKTISYDFRWLHPISDMKAEVEEPISSSNFSVSPEGTLYQSSDGFTLHTYTLTPNINDQPIHFDISYTKSDNRPSMTILGANAPTSSSGTSSSGTGLPTSLWIAIIVVAAAAVAAGGYFFIRRSGRFSTATLPAATTATNDRRSHRRRATRNSPETAARFCPECGEKVNANDKFCANCGHKIGKD